MLYFRQVFNWISQKLIFWLKDQEGGYCGSRAQIFWFRAMATLQLFQHPENVKISILPFTLSQQKCYIFESIWRILKKLSFGCKMIRRCYCGVKISRAQVFLFCNGNVTTFPTSRKCKNFNSSLYTVPAEMLYFRQVFNEFSKNFFCAERRWRLLLWLKISRIQIFWFCNGNVTTFPTSRKCKNFNSSLYTVPAEMLYFRQVFNEFSKTFFRLKDDEGGYCGWKFQGDRYFGFGMATLQLFQHAENVKISILPFTLSQQKCYIFESI